MKLIKCHIENFGTLRSTDIDFKDGLTVIKEDNGFGKSTLAVFLKAMFYGLPQTTVRSLDGNERKKYTPWQGGAFGGTLDFEAGGKQYRIERFFAAKEKDDTCCVYDLRTNTPTNELTDDIGLALFGIDAESFERSVYLPQTDVSTAMSNSLRAKLTGLVESSDDISNFDNAVKAIEKRIKEYSVLGGARGAIAEKSAEIAALEAERNDAVAAAENLKGVIKRLEELALDRRNTLDSITQVRASITALSDRVARVEQLKRRQETADELNNVLAERNGLNARYPEGLPSDELLNDMTEAVRMYDETAAEISVLTSNSDDRSELERIDGFFNGQIPSLEEVANYRQTFNRNIKDEATLETLTARLENAKAVQQPSRKSNVGLLIALAVVLAVAGGVTMVWQLVVGIVLLALGVVLLGAGAFVYLKNMISSNNQGVEDVATLQKDHDDLTEKVRATREAVSRFISLYSSDEPLTALDTITQNLRDRERLIVAVTDSERKLTQKKERAEECQKELAGFFSRFGVGLEGGFADRLTVVKSDIRVAVDLDGRILTLQNKLSEMPKAEDLAVDENAVADKDDLVAKEKELTEHLTEVEGEMSLLEASARRLTAESDGMTEIEERLENAKEQKSDMENKLLILKTTLELLKTAKNDLSLKYLDRMTEGFQKYSDIIMGDGSGESMIDTDLKIRLDRGGAARDKEFFSRGWRDMIDIAMRLALTDALYDNEKPMLILDDPFVNLDDARLEKAMGLLKKLSEERQIVYLTCHSSRC